LIPKWTGEAVKKMHLNGITITELAEFMGMSRPWLNSILTGKRYSQGSRTKVMTAIDEYIEVMKNGKTTEPDGNE